ncbi:VOC family protein [Algirhabdus cladophorae]|uniref:VOC family protein n=1 Tax=Algirhabdus cladophorae TaxID=3377108 RepID=UPI003B8488BE
MAIKRIVLDIATDRVAEVQVFYADLFELDTAMDQGWIVTMATGGSGPVQVSIASEGGSGAPVPNASIEVDNLDEVYAKAQSLGCPIVLPLTAEPWGVRRFFLEDPAGTVLNIMAHD